MGPEGRGFESLFTDHYLKPQSKDWGFCISYSQKLSLHFQFHQNVQLWELLTTHDPNAFQADKRNPSTMAGAL
ncbi:hypothetical protein THOD04_50487 [Vibrio owensii]|nr:hypothetical protein THOD04_50487 [Vibrio owensii]